MINEKHKIMYTKQNHHHLSYYRGAVGALIVYDITKASSFQNVEKWYNELREHADDNIVVMLVGNKTDLKASREVSSEEASKYAKAKGLLYIETSALEGDNIKEAFHQIVNGINADLI